MEPKILLSILRQAEKLKCQTRHADTSSGRRESVAEHSWRLALMALLTAGEFPGLDMGRVVEMCLIHDLGESFTGDIPAFEKNEDHRQREKKALRDWISGFPAPTGERWLALLDEMEERRTDEARLYKALDNLEAVIQHNEGDIASWLPLEYDFQLTYGADKVGWSPYLVGLKAEIDRVTREKIAGEKPVSRLPTLSTRRLVLRPFTLEDLPGLQAILGDEEVMEQLEPPYTPARTEQFLREFCVQGQKALAAVRRDTGLLAGYLLYKAYGDPQVYELGWIFRRDCWRKGYGYEAVRALMDWAFSRGDAQKLFAETVDPVKSAGLMEKLGMVREGVQRRHLRDSGGRWRDLYLYGMTREDWLAGKQSGEEGDTL